MAVSCIYHFEEFRLDPAARELWQGDCRLELPRLTFDGLVFLVENRGRAVSRDELISAVWRRPYVEDIQLTQLMMRLRRVIGDDSHESRFIRTVPGFGYHWVAETEELPAAPAMPAFRRRRILVVMALAAVLLIPAVIFIANQFGRTPELLPREPGEAVAVLPLDVRAPENANAGWLRLGTMDLIAERLRDAGLPVPPSDSVVSALHATTELPEAERLSALRQTLGAGLLVQGTALQVNDGWTIELIAVTGAGDRRRVVSAPAEIIPAARQAADLLLAALGQTAPLADGENETLSEIVQRARAATLALELDTSREILARAPEALRNAPELRYEFAWLEFRAGRFAEVKAIVTELLEDPAVASRPRLHAQTLMIRGIVAASEHDYDWAVGEPFFDVAVRTLDGVLWAPELGMALALRGLARVYLRDFDAAARDLGQARVQLEVAGDRLGLARIHNYFGILEVERKRPAEALPHFQASLEISEAFGHIDWLRANLYSLVNTQTQLLRWSAALAASERLWTLRERIRNPVLRHYDASTHAAVLIGLGQYREAESILDALQDNESDIPSHPLHGSESARAELAWQQGRPEEALRAAARALKLWPDLKSQNAAQTYTSLLHQRASIAVGQAIPAAQTLSDVSVAAADPAYLVAQAEWAAYEGDHGQAERLFREAAAEAERWAVPATLVLVANAYARWLLARDRVPEALALAGRIAGWAEHDYASALLQVAVLRASGRQEAWAVALRRAQSLAGEREIPGDLLLPPAGEK